MCKLDNINATEVNCGKIQYTPEYSENKSSETMDKLNKFIGIMRTIDNEDEEANKNKQLNSDTQV